MNSGLKAENTDNSNKRGRQRAFSDNPVGSRILSALSGRTRKWLAGESGISESSISDYIANGIAKAESAVAIAHALDVSVDWLLTGAAERPYKTGRRQPSRSRMRIGSMCQSSTFELWMTEVEVSALELRQSAATG